MVKNQKTQWDRPTSNIRFGLRDTRAWVSPHAVAQLEYRLALARARLYQGFEPAKKRTWEELLTPMPAEEFKHR